MFIHPSGFSSLIQTLFGKPVQINTNRSLTGRREQMCFVGASVRGRVKIWRYPRRKYSYGKDVGGADHSEVTGNNRESFGRGWIEKPVCDGTVCVRRTVTWFSRNGTFLCQMHQYLAALVSVLVMSKNVVTVLASLGLTINQKTHYTSIVSPRRQWDLRESWADIHI